jgi:PLP dependent protein
MSTLNDNIARVQERIAAACRRAGRQPEEVRLIAVTKTVEPGRIQEAYAAGLRDFGENRVQETAAKRPALAAPNATWHLIGHLQSNKTKAAIELFDWVHSVDSIHLAERLNHAVAAGGAPVPILLQVNLAGEETKSGVNQDEVNTIAEKLLALEHLDCRGLMLIPPASDDPEDARPWFRQLRRLSDELRHSGLLRDSATDLSMGMSHDFEVAIEEGATMVRVGTAIFGERQATV